MRATDPFRDRFWFLTTLALSCVTLLAVIFSVWELIERHYIRGLDYVTLHYLYITRGIASSLLMGLWAAWFVLRERRRHEEELERSNKRYRSILNSTPEAVVLFDDTFRVTEWNPAAEKLYGLTRQQVLGQVLPTVPPERWSELGDLLRRVETGQAVLDHETQRRTAQGDRVPVAVSFSRVPQAGNQAALILELAQDIRPRLRLREKLLEIEKLTLMGQMAAGTAHHLNTPLTAMLLQAEMLRQQVPEASAKLIPLARGVRFCQVFVQNLLRFAHRSQLQREPVAVGDVIDAVATLLRPSVSLKKTDMRIELDGLARSRVLGDPNHLEALFSALVGNAVDAIAEGGTIRIRGVVRRNGEAEIRIEDNGPGIPEALWTRVFEPFFTTKPAGQGTGLGLAIARNIAEEHGGSLLLENREEGGVRATVQLPLLQDAGKAIGTEREKTA